MISQSDEQLLEIAVKQRFLSDDSAQRLQSEALKQSLPVEVLALKAGILAPWQIETIRALSTPHDIAPGYEIKSLLGRGGFGSVYLANQTKLSREVALKTIPLTNADSSTAKRFEREAKIVGQLRHPHIVAAYDFGIHQNRLFLSLELVDGQDLKQVLNRVGKFDELTTWHIIRQTVTALAYAAEHDVTHRDIKPGNLLATRPPIGYSLPSHVPFIKVSDFGLACFSETRSDEGITRDNSGLGTPSYVAPEQLRGSDVDVTADIYSLGATAYHLLTGRAPYAGMTAIEVATEKLSGNESWPTEFNEEISPESSSLLAEMSCTDVDSRIASHHELLLRIDALLAESDARFEQETKIFELPSSGTNAESDPDAESKKFSDDLETRSSADFDSNFVVDHSSDPRSSRVKVDGTARRSKRKTYPAIAFGIGICGIGLVAYLLFFSIDPTSNNTQMLQPDASSVSRSFDGLKLDYSKFKLKRGTWSIEDDEEGGKILAGTNCEVAFPCQGNTRQPLEYFRFSIGVGRHPKMMTRLSANFSNAIGSAFSLLLSSEGAQIQLEEQPGRYVSDSPVVPWQNSTDQSSGYHRITIERQPQLWRVFVDAELIYETANQNAAPAEIVIDSVGNTLFESPEVFQLVQSEISNQR